jgi:hypothetical protein
MTEITQIYDRKAGRDLAIDVGRPWKKLDSRLASLQPYIHPLE